MPLEDLTKARAYAFRLIKFRLRSEQEIRERLKRKDFARTAIDATVDFLKKAGLLDDALFARLWAASRLKKPLSLRSVHYELKQKGIALHLIEETLKSYKEDYREEEVIQALIGTRLKKMKHLSQEKIKARLYGFLLRRGYGQSLVIDALNKALSSSRSEDSIE